MDTGLKQRLAILRRDAEQKILGPLRTHYWKAAIEQEVANGEYLIISTERGGYGHRVALLYTSATDNVIYKSLATQVEHIFVNGPFDQIGSFAYGFEKMVSTIDGFHTLLLKWNEASSDGKFAPTADSAESIIASRPQHRVLLSEEPIQAIWLRLRQLQSVTLAKKLIAERVSRGSVRLDDESIRSKSEGLAFALRNASDYFHMRDVRNLSQRVLNLYYGSLSFVFAEMLASPTGLKTLGEIESNTKQGHGLYTIDGVTDGLENIVLGVISSGIFPAWMKAMGFAMANIPDRKAREQKDLAELPSESWLTVEQLFARIPEVSDLFADIFESAPSWVTPVFDGNANASSARFGAAERNTRTYALLVDDSARLTKEDIAKFPGPISEIRPIVSKEGGGHFRVAIDHAGKDIWWDALKLHHSPFERHALIMPVFGVVDEYRAICVALLYALSIVVRYRPGLWRRVQEGDLDHLRVLIEAFLVVAERVLPEQFLETVTGQRVFAKQPGAW